VIRSYRNVVSNSQVQEIFCVLYHHSRVHGNVVYCVWYSDYNNDSIILHYNKRSIFPLTLSNAKIVVSR